MAAAHQAGMTMKELATALGIHRNTVSNHLRQHGFPIRMQGLREEDIREAVRLYEEGWSSWMLGEKFGVSPKTVLTALRKVGVRVRPGPGGPRSTRSTG